MMTDPIADMLTRIRNANRTSKPSLAMPASKMKVGIAAVLQDEGFITGYSVEESEPANTLRLELKYGPEGEHVIRTIDRVSKPGRRVYWGARSIPKVLDGLGIFILSTPKGVVSDRTARADNVGGEILCKVF